MPSWPNSGVQTKVPCAVAVVGEYRSRGFVSDGECYRIAVGISRGGGKAQFDAFVGGLVIGWIELRRTVDITDGNQKRFEVGQHWNAVIGNGDQDVRVVPGLAEVRGQVKGRCAIAIVGQTRSGLGRC